MAEPSSPPPALLVVALFSRHSTALDWGKTHLEANFGPIALEGELFDFCHTKYYEASMGLGQRKQLICFQQLTPPQLLANVKIQTNQLERQLAATMAYADSRPLNIDTGFLTLGKFVLATTKDQAHRVYMRDGIYAEVTLRFQDGQFEPWPWTYADYREPNVLETLNQFRNYYKRQLSEHR